MTLNSASQLRTFGKKVTLVRRRTYHYVDRDKVISRPEIGCGAQAVTVAMPTAYTVRHQLHLY